MIYKKDLLGRIKKLESDVSFLFEENNKRKTDTSGWEISKEIARVLKMEWKKEAVKETSWTGDKAVLVWKLVKLTNSGESQKIR